MNNPYKARFQITGIIEQIGEIKTFSSGFQKREIVVNTNANYPSPIPLSLRKDDCGKTDGLSVGDEVSVEGFVNGRKWDGPNGTRYFPDLVVKSIMTTNKAAAPATAQAAAPQTVEDDNEMPF